MVGAIECDDRDAVRDGQPEILIWHDEPLLDAADARCPGGDLIDSTVVPVKLHGVALVLLSALFGAGSLAYAHVDPPECSSSGVGLTLALFRADGKTGLKGLVSECERTVFRVTLRKADPSVCAVSGGTLRLDTPDGVTHVLESPVPCIGGTTDDTNRRDTVPIVCSSATSLVTGLVPYAVRPADVRDGFVTAIARYDGGAFHDLPNDTPGAVAATDRNAEVLFCTDADPCTRDICDPDAPGAAACSYAPLCDDDDATTVDVCRAGECIFTPIASSERDRCGAMERR